MKALIEQYINSQSLAWAASTIKSEGHRLSSVAHLLDKTPTDLWNHILTTQKPYSRVTTWTRVTHFTQWLIDSNLKQGPNHYEVFRKKNARLFKNAYTQKFPDVTYQEAKEKIKRIPSSDLRAVATFIISNALRFNEHKTADRGRVIGKGNKQRNIFGPGPSTRPPSVNYQTFRRALRSVGLKPHDLRKIAATELVNHGLKEADLCKVMGWSSIVTAKSYLIPKQDDELRNLFERINNDNQ